MDHRLPWMRLRQFDDVVARAVVLEVELVLSVGDGHQAAALVHLNLERVHLERDHTARSEAVRPHITGCIMAFRGTVTTPAFSSSGTPWARPVSEA